MALTELGQILDFFRGEKEKVVVLTGQGKAFAAGADVAAMSQMDAISAEGFSRLGNSVLQIAAING